MAKRRILSSVLAILSMSSSAITANDKNNVSSSGVKSKVVKKNGINKIPNVNKSKFIRNAGIVGGMGTALIGGLLYWKWDSIFGENKAGKPQQKQKHLDPSGEGEEKKSVIEDLKKANIIPMEDGSCEDKRFISDLGELDRYCIRNFSDNDIVSVGRPSMILDYYSKDELLDFSEIKDYFFFKLCKNANEIDKDENAVFFRLKTELAGENFGDVFFDIICRIITYRFITNGEVFEFFSGNDEYGYCKFIQNMGIDCFQVTKDENSEKYHLLQIAKKTDEKCKEFEKKLKIVKEVLGEKNKNLCSALKSARHKTYVSSNGIKIQYIEFNVDFIRQQ